MRGKMPKRSERAYLEGYRRHRIVDREYPAIASSRTTTTASSSSSSAATGIKSTSVSVVDGLLLHGLSDDDIKYLDLYEGPEYKRIECKVSDMNEVPTVYQCFVYIWDDDLSLLYDDWKYDEHFIPISAKYIARMKGLI